MKPHNKKNYIIIFAIILLLIVGFIFLNPNISLKNNNSGDNIALSGDTPSNNLDIQNLDTQNSNIQSQNEINYKYIFGSVTIDGIEFSNYRVNPIGINKCEFITDVKNLTENYSKARNIRVKIINASGDVQDIFGGILTELAPYEPNIFKTQLLSKIDEDASIVIEIVNK